MLPTKGYFQNIECPYNNNSCGRPYCHFRHRKKPTEESETSANDPSPAAEVPTYKPTPKSELAIFNKSHIPISYVPDRTSRQKSKLDNATYKPTPLSILSSATKRGSFSEEHEEHFAVIREIKQNMANTQYNPVLSLQDKPDINFEDLDSEFNIIDEIIKGDEDNEIISDEKTSTKKDCDDTTKSKSTEKKTRSSSSSSKKPRDKSSENHKKEESKSSKSTSKSSSRHTSSSKHKSSSRDKHRKEEKRDSTKDRSKHKSSKKSSRKDEPSKSDKKKSDHKSKTKDKEKPKKIVEKKDIEDEPKRIEEEPKATEEEPKTIEMIDDDDLEDEDDTMLECYKIFNEYKPDITTPMEVEEVAKKTLEVNEQVSTKKRIAHLNAENPSQVNHSIKQKLVTTPGQIMTNRFKIAQQVKANREQENLINELKQPTLKRPPPSLLEAYRQHKINKPSVSSTSNLPKTSNIIDEILTSSSKPTTNHFKIAPVKNVSSIQKAKARIIQISKQQTTNKTIAQTQKTARVAHVPDYCLSDIPDVIQAANSKLPVNVRTRFLTMIADECSKLYLIKEDGFARALNEEFICYEKCKVLTTYRNSAMLAVNRIRKELGEREKLGLGPIDSGESSGTNKQSDFQGHKFYNNVKQWLLTEEELDLHGYPRESNTPGRAQFHNKKNSFEVTLSENQRKCCRCHKIFLVDDDGWPLYEEECVYHPLKKRTIRGEQTYLCCRSNDDSGCATSDTHVSESISLLGEQEGFQTTLPPESDDDSRNTAVYALDCEMCYTTKGLELTRVTIVDVDCKTVYESLVKPLNPIIDYNTRFSGITKEQMDRTSTSILQIQANILHLCNAQTILVGHSLESDMKALKIVHSSVIDTSVLFPHKMGLPHKRALKVLASEFLKKIIQNDVGGHDSAEDAITCMELIKWKLKEELKLRGTK